MREPQTKTNVLKVVLFVGVVLLGIYSYIEFHRKYSSNVSKVEYLIFCQEYPASACRTSAHADNCKQHESEINAWSIHGIWPTYTEGDYPEYCQKIDFDVDALKPIEAELKTHWFSLYGDNADFWKHEWSKHGTCAVNDTSLKTELIYFERGLQWNEQYPIQDILARQNIFPRDKIPYSIDDIHKAFVSELGVGVGIACEEQHIIEIRMCFSMELELIDCNGSQVDACDYNEVYYPKNYTKSNGYL